MHCGIHIYRAGALWDLWDLSIRNSHAMFIYRQSIRYVALWIMSVTIYAAPTHLCSITVSQQNVQDHNKTPLSTAKIPVLMHNHLCHALSNANHTGIDWWVCVHGFIYTQLLLHFMITAGCIFNQGPDSFPENSHRLKANVAVALVCAVLNIRTLAQAAGI